MSSQSEPTRLTRPPEPLRIVNWPLKDERWSSGCMLAAMAAAGFTVMSITGSVILGLFTFAAFGVSVWRLWLPVTFDFGQRGIVQTCWKRQRRIPWPQVARYEVLAHGVLLSADADRTVLSPLRSIYVRWNKQKDELLEQLDFFLSESGDEANA